MPILPGRYTHHVEVVRVDHGYRRSRVRVEEVLIIIFVIVNTSGHLSRGWSTPGPRGRSHWSHWSHRSSGAPSHPHFLFSQRQLALPQLKLALPHGHIRAFGIGCLNPFGYIAVVHQIAKFLL